MAIFIVSDDGNLIEVKPQPYSSEEDLQVLLAKYPRLLATQLTGDIRWLLVRREMGLSDDVDAPSRWSIDHVFIDDRGIPTLVEVKRSTNTEIRRAVVGQMLDYAANAVRYLPPEELRASFRARAEREGLDPSEVLAEHIGDRFASEDDFWTAVKTNLQAGRLRLVFVADEIPSELRRIIEFLNEQMDPTEVLGVELQHFKGPGVRTIVPKLVGQSAAEKVTPARKWDKAAVFARFEEAVDLRSAAAAKALVEWASQEGFDVWWGNGKIHAAAAIGLPGSQRRAIVTLWDWSDRMHVELTALSAKLPPFSDPELRERFRVRISNSIDHPIAATARPTFPFEKLLDPEYARKVREDLLWAREQDPEWRTIRPTEGVP